jgi:protein-disulfide isomerase
MSNIFAVPVQRWITGSLLMIAFVLSAGAVRNILQSADPAEPDLRLLSLGSTQLLGEDRLYAGPTQAAFTLIEFGDYECPPCRAHHDEVVRLSHDYGRILRVEFRHHPLKMHPSARGAALFAEAARLNGQFGPAHDALMSGFIDETGLRALSLKTGVKFPLSSSTLRQASDRIKADTELAQKLGLSGTPSFVLYSRQDGQAYVVASLDDVRLALEASDGGQRKISHR